MSPHPTLREVPGGVLVFPMRSVLVCEAGRPVPASGAEALAPGGPHRAGLPVPLATPEAAELDRCPFQLELLTRLPAAMIGRIPMTIQDDL